MLHQAQNCTRQLTAAAGKLTRAVGTAAEVWSSGDVRGALSSYDPPVEDVLSREHGQDGEDLIRAAQVHRRDEDL